MSSRAGFMEARRQPLQRREAVLFAALALVAGAIWLHLHHDRPWEFWIGQDEMEYADMSRRIARGDGFTTGLIYPVELEYGAERDHPNLLRPPLWPLVLGLVFAVSGPSEAAAHGLLLLLFVSTVVACGALGSRLGGPALGLAAGIAVATCPPTQTLAFLSGTEPLFTLLLVAAFLLMARGAPPFAVGVACGLAYLTRYNGIVLLPIALAWCLLRSREWKAPAVCLAGFVAIAAPWWVRNVVVTGDPFFSYYRNAIRVPPGGYTHYTQTIMHYLDPTTAPGVSSPLEKLRRLLPEFILHSPFLSTNLAACAGWAIGCVRRDRLSFLFVGLVALSTLVVALALPKGRYVAPLLPLLLVLGCSGWFRLGRWFAVGGVALVLAAPLLPSPVPTATDLKFLRGAFARRADPRPQDPSRTCIASDDLVLGERASNIAWETDATSIWLPATEADFWQVVERFPVEYVYIATREDLLTPRFREHFEPREDCGGQLYQRVSRSREATRPPRPPSP